MVFIWMKAQAWENKQKADMKETEQAKKQAWLTQVYMGGMKPTIMLTCADFVLINQCQRGQVDSYIQY